MRIITLVENTSVSELYKAAHGLSFYIETRKHKILFDLGPGKLFLENARKLGVNIADVDTVIISHGHVDHGGGLGLFLEKNNKAKIYIQENAFRPHSLKMLFLYFPVGLDKNLEKNERIIFTGSDLVIDEELLIFSGVIGRDLYSRSNRKLYEKIDGKTVRDMFSHELNLIVSENGGIVGGKEAPGKKLLLAGCSHSGIVNIADRAREITGDQITDAICGMHMMNFIITKPVKTYVEALGTRLMEQPIQYYACHCTGLKPYKILHDIMGEQIKYAATGSLIEL